MDDIVSGLDPDELMDLDEAEGSDLDDDEEDIIDDPVPSPFQILSSGPGSTATSTASSPPNNEDLPPTFNLTGKPLNIKRGRGRPRREGGKPVPKRPGNGTRVRKLKPPGYQRGGGVRKFKNFERFDFDITSITPSPNDEMTMLDPETGALIITSVQERDKQYSLFDDLPYFPEQWPGKVCAFCNLGERSQLGQGEMLRLTCPDGFIPQRIIVSDQTETSNNSNNHNNNNNNGNNINNVNIVPTTPERDTGDKSPRGPVTCRRQKSFNKCRHPSLTNEYVDELTVIGYIEEPDVSVLFDTNGYFYVHRSCALWSHGVTKNENSALENVGPTVLQSSSRKCSFCNHYGASISCKVEGCTKIYHFPCATASGAFQVLNTLTLFCINHIGQASIECEDAVCYTCKTLGDIANLMYCSSCGEHYHGTCVGLAQMPGVRAGWQCRKCRICQVCRVTGDETKLMNCEQCDKVYHATCQRPVVTSIPKYGWKCRCCRVCGDCGSRTPGAGLSSRWHAHYTVCDSCYQQRNKGFCCPLCHRAYRAHAHREMVQCTICRKFVHGTCDPDADLMTYHQRKEAHPEYEYVCLVCKNLTQPGQLLSKRSSIDDPMDSLTTSQETLYDENLEIDAPYSMDTIRSMGLGKGKPYSACKIAKKRLGLTTPLPGRPKGVGKGLPGKVGFMKRQRLTEFGRKRGPKAKMRGIFGVPGVGLQRPVSDGKNDDEPGVENKLVLCSAKDKFVLTQDICVMCGALGTDQEGCLIACVQCGQCYHPYCVNVKVTKVILQKGWRCLDCTVCEGCGQRNDESRLILCDDCDISYHIYCMDPPLDYVPHGNWKCKWCAICQSCGAKDPGFNCTWMNSFTECGPCASHVTCPSCSEPYSEGDLIIQCVQCERWLHGACDSIKTEEDAEKCAEEGYNCLFCRPRDVLPPHLVPSAISQKPPTPTKSSDFKSSNYYYIDGVYLSEAGHNLIKSLSLEQHVARKKRKKLATVQDKEAGIMATIESVVSGTTAANMLDDSAKLELVDIKDEPQELYKEGMIWTKDDGPPPEGFTLFTMENGVCVLRRKRQRNLQKLGIGGFGIRARGIRGQDNDDNDTLPSQLPTNGDLSLSVDMDKPRRKPIRRKPKSKLAETFPQYLQEAFFGKELLDSTKEVDSSSSDEEKHNSDNDKTIQLTQDEIKAVAAVSGKNEPVENITQNKTIDNNANKNQTAVSKEEDEEENTEDLKDVLAIPGDLLDTDLVNTIMNEDDPELSKNAESLDALTNTNLPDDTDIALGNTNTSKETKDELTDILGPNFNLETIPNINGKDVEDIFKGVLTDDSQESQESSVFSMQNNNNFPANTPQTVTQHPVPTPPVRPTTLQTVNQTNLNSPLNFPPPSPYQSEYSNSPQFSPAFSEPASPWVSVNDGNDLDTAPSGVPSTYNQRSSEKMKADEGLGNGATISAVLYANINHPEWKTDFPNWTDRYKQILKKWRTLSSDQKAPYLQQARDNRSALRMKKQQQSQMNKEMPNTLPTTKATPATATPAVVTVSNIQSSTQVPAIVASVSEDQEKVALQQKSAREAEQERQWKQLQALRQQQAQQQQHVIHEQRVQAIARAQRQISDPSQPFPQDQSPQELSPVTSPSPNPRQLLQLGIKSPPFTHPNPTSVKPPTPQTPIEFPTINTNNNDPYSKPPGTPKPQQTYVRLPSDPYAQQPATPRPPPQFSLPRPNLQGLNNVTPVRPGEGPEYNRQLRDLLQRQQQFKKIDDALLPGKNQRPWTPNETNSETETPVANIATTVDATFRHPLPVVRPRMPVPVSNLPRQPGPLLGLRMQQVEPRMQGLDPRMRLLIQQQQQRIIQANSVTTQQQVFTNNPIRFSNIVRPASIEQFEQHLQKQQLSTSFQGIGADQQLPPRLPVPQNTNIEKPANNQTTTIPTPNNNTTVNSTNSEQEIPDNVTAELEKLEQENGTMVELQGVGDILGGLGEDDDELLAEMGPDFNILEYADPEALPGEKTNILDLELEEEPLKNVKNVKVEVPKTQTSQQNVPTQIIKKEVTQSPSIPPNLANNPPPLTTSQSPVVQPQRSVVPTSLTPQQIHQQMIAQVQQAAARGHPMPPGSKLQTHDGIIGIVMPNNNVHLQIPATYQQRIIVSQLQNQKLQMRVGQNIPRMMSVAAANPTQPTLHAGPVGLNPRLGVPPSVPPPPYPGPPPPYPGSSATPQLQQQQQPQQQPPPPPPLPPPLQQQSQQLQLQQQPQPLPPPQQSVPSSLPTTPQLPQQPQTGLRMGPVHLPLGHMYPMRQQGLSLHPHMQRRSLLLEEQPLLLEDLLEQEKREQEKQNQNQIPTSANDINSSTNSTIESQPSALLSDHDFERLKADVFSGNTITTVNSNVNSNSNNWQQNQPRPTPPSTPAIQSATEIRVQTFNANTLPPPPLPPENILTEQDKQKQIVYEQWLNHQNNVLSQQLKYYETEVQKLRKARKSLNSKQRQLRKSGNQLAEADATELQRISAEQAILQKHLESSRKLSRQHGLLIQEYRNKQQAKQRPSPGQSPLLVQSHSPLGPPSSSPIQHPSSSQSPMMSPSASPLTQHNSPLHSPSPIISPSPGPGTVTNLLQSPNSISGNNMSPMQPSPRIGTPHSQSEGSPGPVASPSQVCLPPPAPRMTSPQHRRVVTSPVSYTGELRPGTPQMRFVRTPVDHSTGGLQQRVTRLPSPMSGYQQKPGTPSPLNSPPPSQQMHISQQLIQKQLQQHNMLQQNLDNQQTDANILNSQRAVQLIQQRNFVRQQMAQQQQQQQQQLQHQQPQQQQQQPSQLSQGINQPQPLTPQQHQLMIQQQQQLHKQQQQQIAQLQAQLQSQNRLNQQQPNPPSSPMPPKSPLVGQQMMSPHSMPPSPMPPKSPMMPYGNNQQPPSSPIARSPAFHQNPNQPPSSPMTHNQYQPPSSPMPRSPLIGQTNSPMGIRRPPSANSSPAMPERPTSVDNSLMNRPQYQTQTSLDNAQLMENNSPNNRGGGNPNNPNNPIPLPAGLANYTYCKLGLRGGSPMWSFGRGAKRIPTPPGTNKDLDKTNELSPMKPKKESHLSKVSILKRKSPAKTNLQSLAISKVGSLVSTDYNEFDDSSCTPPVTPPPVASTSRASIQKTIGKKVTEVLENKESSTVLLDDSPDEKQIRCEDIMDYEDDNNTVISGEVSLSSTAQQNDGDDIAVIETFSQSDIGEVMSSPLESDQIADEYVLFPGNMVVDITSEAQYSDKEEEVEEDYASENMHVVIRSPTTSDDEYIMQNKTKKYNIQSISSNQLLSVGETPDSPEEIHADPSPDTADDEIMSNYEESEIVIIDPTVKSPEEQISTKEDFEELIDEGSRKEKLMKPDILAAKHINEIHKYAANVHNVPEKIEPVSTTNNTTTTSTSSNQNVTRSTNLIGPKLSPQISLVTTPFNITTVSRTEGNKINAEMVLTHGGKLVTTTAGSKVTSIILQGRSNVLNMPKLVTSGSQAFTIVSASTSQIASILPPGFTVPVISASAVRQLPNVKVIDKPSSSLSLTTHDTCLPKKIFEDDSISPENSISDDEKLKNSINKSKIESNTELIEKLESKSLSLEQNKNVEESKETPLSERKEQNDNAKSDANNIESSDALRKKVEDMFVGGNTKMVQQNTSPTVSKSSSPVIIPNTPELKMTAQVIQKSPTGMQITARTESVEGMDCNTCDDSKSVEISIPSPTPSQEQMLDSIALQALENRRRDGKNIPSEFESFEDVLDMLENITADPPSVLENSIKEKLMHDTDKVEVSKTTPENQINTTNTESSLISSSSSSTSSSSTSIVTTTSQLSPLSQPTELTTNMANASQQLLSLLSSFHTTSTVTGPNTIDTVTKNSNQKPVTTTVTATAASIVVTSKLNQQTSTVSSAVTTVNTVIVPNTKQKVLPSSSANQENIFRSTVVATNGNETVTSILTSSSASNQHLTTNINILSTYSTNGNVNLSNNSKITNTTASSGSSSQITTNTGSLINTIVSKTSSNDHNEVRKTTYSLTEMLQSHPAATPTTKSSADTITAASLLGTSISLSRSNFNTSLVQAQPNAVVTPIATTVTTTPTTNTTLSLTTSSFSNVNISSPLSTSSGFKPITSNTNLLHTHLTKIIRSKSVDEATNEPQKTEEITKIDTNESSSSVDEKNSFIMNIKQEISGCKLSTIPIGRTEDSQNVLLKKLLQNTACASTQTPIPSSSATTITVSAPIQFNNSDTIKTSTPTLSSILPPVTKESVSNTNEQQPQSQQHPHQQPQQQQLQQFQQQQQQFQQLQYQQQQLQYHQQQQQQQQRPVGQRMPIITRETSFVSNPIVQQSQIPTTSIAAQQQLHIDIKRCMPPSRTPSRDDLLSPPTPRSSCSQDSNLQTPPLLTKKETPFLQQTLIGSQEMKKEFVDETSQHSEISDHSRSDVQMKEEMDSLDAVTEKMLLEKEELKKQKRRMYQQKRRQNQILNKDIPGQPKKRPRKSSKVDEDYDTYIDSVLAQLRTLPPMQVSEPILNRNLNILPIFGSDFSKLSASDYDTRYGELIGEYGNAVLPGCSDFYNTQPYGDEQPLNEKPQSSTQRGFYDQEFPPIKFENEDDKRFDLFCREDTPDSIISSSSPECPIREPPHKFLGLKLISDDDDDDEDNTDKDDVNKMRLSPVVPIIAPIPIRLKPAGTYLKDYADDKENCGREMYYKSKFGPTPGTPLKDSGNVTVTLTLTSSAAEDIMGVLRDLANILHIPAPTSYQIIERTTTPPSQKLGLYRTKGKDGKEGAPIDIQSILNGAAKFCKHCDVVILNNMIKKKVSELPFLSKDSELLNEDELFFCSSTCYTQFALMNRSSVSVDKAAAIIDHLSQKDTVDVKTKKLIIESTEQRKLIVENVEIDLRPMKKDIEMMDTSDTNNHMFLSKPTDNRLRTDDLQQIQIQPQLQMQQQTSQSRVFKGTRYKSWTPGCLQPSVKYKKPTDKEIMELLYRLGITVTPQKLPEDSRRCMFCQGVGDSVADGPARLLNFDVDKWVHLNCGLWSDGVYETVNGALMNLENALQQSLTSTCVHCNKLGATIRCFKTRCSNIYHLPCAVKDACVFYKNKTTYCSVHAPKTEKDNELTTLSVSRRVYVNRDENRQVAAVMHHSDTNNLLRVGSLIFLNVGQLLPHQLQNFHTPNYIYPIGYKIIRFYWSMRHLNKRCRYICSIHENLGRPEFRITVQEINEEDLELKDTTCKGVWQRILDQIAAMRRDNQCVQVFPKYVTGEDLFGLTEPAVVRVLESLPGIETLTDYKFKYGRNPLLELPLAINPSGAARTEPRLRNQLHWKRPHTQRTAGSTVRPLFGPSPSLSLSTSTLASTSVSSSTVIATTSTTLGEVACPYSKQFVHSKSSQYKKMKQEWRNNVYLARSKIQGLGLYAARDLEKHTMVIEYIGEIIRTELAETREKKYEAKNRGIYMFRLDEERVVDATLCGGLARYINHSCNPNCVAETVEVDRDYRIIIFAKRRIQRGEELAYDYKFDIEDDQHKISCMCGAPNCRKWMN